MLAWLPFLWAWENLFPTPGIRTLAVSQDGREFTAVDNRATGVPQENRGFVATDGRLFVVGVENRNLS
jgi:hypothetical protein